MNEKSGPKAAPRVSPPSLTADQSNTTALPGDCAQDAGLVVMSVEAIFSALSGREMPGGCDDCNAYQTVNGSDGVFVVTVHHDGGCPFLTRWDAK